MAETISIRPIGWVRSTRKDPVDDRWDAESAVIELDGAQFSAEALEGLGEFSHAKIIFYMDRVDPSRINRGARHPRDNKSWPRVGVFAHRGKERPNQLGITICQVERVEGSRLFVRGLDAIDGTPVIDIKPWVEEFGPRGPVRQPKWITELMSHYWTDE